MFDFKFDWDERINIGIYEIDKQHQELFRIARDIEQLIITGTSELSDVQVLEKICEIREYITYHFYTEEKVMEAINSEQLEEHKRQHEAFKKSINLINCTELVKNPVEELKKIKQLMQSWLFEHIIIEDKKIINNYL